MRIKVLLEWARGAAEGLLLLALAGSALAGERPAADLIVTNARVWTVDQQHPTAEAVAVIGERIVAVGSSADIDQWRGVHTRVLDAGGKLLLPGFNDAHVHFVSGGLSLTAVQLKDAPTALEFARRIGERARTTPKGEWILGGDWDEQQWSPAQLPTRALIDAVAPQTPVAVNRYDGHMVCTNSLALRLAGITAKTPDPPGGVIVRDPKGEPTGCLKDSAQDLLDRALPALSHEQRLRAIRQAMAHAAQVGVTSVQQMANSGPGQYDDLKVYEELDQRGELTTRIYFAPMIDGWQDEARLGVRPAYGTHMLRIGALKAYADGSLGSATAYMFQPFTDQPHNRGLLNEGMIPLSRMRTRMLGADKAGLQLCVHAIGDAAISQVLDLYEEVEKANGERDRRWRIEHAQHMAAKDFERFARLHVIASVQPYHAIDDGRWAVNRLGPERIKTTYAFRTFLDHGVRLALGTDWDVAPLDPMLTVYAAVTRATLDGKNPGGWLPEQKLTVAEAVEAYTMGSAYAEFQEKEKGSITPGKLADMVVLSDDIFSIKPEAIREVKVETTILGGRIIWPPQAESR